jgi:hypothetical protein
VASASADIGNVIAAGVQLVGAFATLDNEAGASILASAESGQGITYGADAFSIGALVTGTSAYIANAGTIAAESSVHGGQGISTAIGSEAYGIYGFATTTNYGTISALAMDDSAEASYSFAYAVINNTFYLQQVASAVNHGEIEAHADTYFGAAIAYGVMNHGLYSATDNAEGASISAVAEVSYAGMANAVGSSSYGKYYSHDTNAGTISAYASSAFTEHYGRFTYASAGATGVLEDSRYFGGAVLENSGLITATAITRDLTGFFDGLTGATGVHQYGKYYAGVQNSGDIYAYAQADLGVVSAYGIVQRAKYGAITYVGNAEGASIVAEAHSGSVADDTYGGRAFADGVRMFSGSFALLYNDGLISASSSVDANDRDYTYHGAISYAYGSYQRGQYGATLHNTGTIQAQAEADFGYATSYGSWMRGFYYAASYNEGEITAVALADDGEAFAVANYVDSPAQNIYQYCLPYGGGCVYSYYGGLAALENDGSLDAFARADRGLALAYGGVVVGRLHAQAANRGDIQAVASAQGGSARAVGLLLRSDYGDAWVDNGEGASIVAAAYGDDASATALWLGAYGQVRVDNAGEIRALGDGERIAIDVRETAGAAIYNSGLVAGSILGGAGDEPARQRHRRRAAPRRCRHRAGLPRYLRQPLLQLRHRLGGRRQQHRHGRRAGRLARALLESLRLLQRRIDRLPGRRYRRCAGRPPATSPATATSTSTSPDWRARRTRCTSTVASYPAPRATINVALLDLSQDLEDIVPIVQVSGDSAAGDFALGEVLWDQADSFVSLDFELLADIDDSNAAPDAFALGIHVTGLSDTGALAAGIPGAVQGLVNSQIGTWRQRMGVIDAFHDGGDRGWGPRGGATKGGFSPEHRSGFGELGNVRLATDELGRGGRHRFRVTDEFTSGCCGQVASRHAPAQAGRGRGRHRCRHLGHSTAPGSRPRLLPRCLLPLGRLRRRPVFRRGRYGDRRQCRKLQPRTRLCVDAQGRPEARAAVQYTKTRVDDIGELATTGGMRFANDGGESSHGRLGLALRKSFGDAEAAWAWTPYASLSAVREFDGENRFAINDLLPGAETDLEGTSSLLELGVAARHQGWTLNAASTGRTAARSRTSSAASWKSATASGPAI